jgi:hypothetical protein
MINTINKGQALWLKIEINQSGRAKASIKGSFLFSC